MTKNSQLIEHRTTCQPKEEIMTSKKITIAVAGSPIRKTVEVRQGMSVREVKETAGIPAEFSLSLQNGDFFLADGEDLSTYVVGDDEVLYASARPKVGHDLP